MAPKRDAHVAAHSTVPDFTPILLSDFQERTGIDLHSMRGLEDIEWIVSPRDIKEVLDIKLMRDDYRDQLLASIGVVYNRERRLYRGLETHMHMIDPSTLVLGQKYVYRKNYISIVEGFRDLFKGFGVTRGFTRLSAYLIIGKTAEGRLVLGQYLPPIVEKHGDRAILLDGVHRNFLARAAGVSIECIVIEGVAMTFSCTPHSWYDVLVVDEKPPRTEDRYWELDRNLFRDLKYVGIDG